MFLKKLIPLFTLLISLNSFGHGYIIQPESRVTFCRDGVNTNCGAIQFEPQSLESVSGFPAIGDGIPPDGEIPSAGIVRFSELNIQTDARWAKASIAAGENQFTWMYTANHRTRNWRYFITRQDWDPNQPVTRDSFVLEPFCTIDGNNEQPPTPLNTHDCVVPSRTGYQLILSVWEIADTVNSFYNIIDVTFDGDPNPNPDPDPDPDPTPDPDPDPTIEFQQIGTIFPTVELRPGDSVRARVFDAQGEIPALQVELVINDVVDGSRTYWPQGLARQINQQQNDLRAGQMNEDGTFTPVLGENPIFATVASGLTRVEIDIMQQPVPPPSDGDFDFTFPEGLSSYVAGTRVLQPRDGRIYECRPFPFSGFCIQYSPNNTAFEPGFGTSSDSAWILVE
ncbi:N-acetylglucosamine-binding protein GbpA [Alteromonadaceae bacterium M269]|nr:N-acetylglucosamine-binding protein GbpA [Alteromonadaceae bacterium M269]